MFGSNENLIVVVGATGALGKMISHSCAQQGSAVVAVGRTIEKLNLLVDELQASGHKALSQVCDINNDNEVRKAFAKIASRGRIMGVVNVAAIRPWKQFFDITKDDWDATLQTNLTGAFLVTQEAAKYMLDTGGGSIVNVSSVVGLRSLSYYRGAHYAASKAGLVGLTVSLATELQEFSISVNALVPGPIQYPNHELANEIKSTISSPTPAKRVVEEVCKLIFNPPSKGEVVILE